MGNSSVLTVQQVAEQLGGIAHARISADQRG